MSQPTLLTNRLTLRPFTLTDAPCVQQLAGKREIAAMTLRIPHPYGDGMAEAWIAAMPAQARSGENFAFAITLSKTEELIGAIGLEVQPAWERAELGYWIGVPYWGNGYATEAACELLRFGFEELRLNRIFASVFTNNSVSRRVLEKAGLTYEGRQRQSIKKWDEFLDTETYAILREDGR